MPFSFSPKVDKPAILQCQWVNKYMQPHFAVHVATSEGFCGPACKAQKQWFLRPSVGSFVRPFGLCVCVCLITYVYPAACDPGDHGSYNPHPALLCKLCGAIPPCMPYFLKTKTKQDMTCKGKPNIQVARAERSAKSGGRPPLLPPP